MQDVVSEWTFELRSGQVLWLPDRLIDGIREVGLQSIIGDRCDEQLVDKATRLLYRVQWERIDPTSTTRPTSNYYGAPIFHSGDVISFNPILWELDCIGALMCQPRTNFRRCNQCGPDLRMWRDSKSGNGLATTEFFMRQNGGVRVD